MIVLFTDYGLHGPYTGQLKAMLLREAPGVPVIDLLADAPAYDPRRSAYLLAAYYGAFPAASVFLCIIDPGVGSARDACVLRADARWFVAPDNGLLAIVSRRSPHQEWWRVTWQPPALSATFHGRDLFAPVAAMIARGQPVPGEVLARQPETGAQWPDDLPEIIYIDRFGNAMTGLRACTLPPGTRLEIAGKTVVRARTFADVAPGEAFWYENANGLVEIAVNRGRADASLGLACGAPVSIARV
jgi:S-adenosylmethionine hydrolase